MTAAYMRCRRITKMNALIEKQVGYCTIRCPQPEKKSIHESPGDDCFWIDMRSSQQENLLVLLECQRVVARRVKVIANHSNEALHTLNVNDTAA